MKFQVDEDQYLTSQQIEHRLDITPMTLYLWRKPSATMPAIPHIVQKRGNRNAIFFPIDEVEKWIELYRPEKKDLIRKDDCGCWHCNRRRRKANDLHKKSAGNNTPVEVI